MPEHSLSILLVEDADFEAEITRRALLQCDFPNTLTRVASGEAALSLLRQETGYEDQSTPDVVFLDLNLPMMNGREVLREIRDDPKLSHLVVIVFSTSDDPKDVIECYRGTANAYIAKPLGLDALTRRLNKLGDFYLNVVELPESPQKI